MGEDSAVPGFRYLLMRRRLLSDPTQQEAMHGIGLVGLGKMGQQHAPGCATPATGGFGRNPDVSTPATSPRWWSFCPPEWSG